ncbi:hypothetical protein [Butyrivibrio sp. LB2008]|uniref:hypothetical protein n=1 Tax=Butyrivibrio sp. LB2008 TaxID=1408305 RepID=UPI00047C9E2D|nr:hypothetical protein [Butyrivibrio sp. LB2008]
MENYRDNLQIDLKDLAHYVLKFWKIIFIIAVVGALLGGICQFATGGSASAEAAPVSIPELSEEEMTKVNAAVSSYKTYQELHDTVMESINSDLEKIKAGEVLDKDSAEALEYKTSIISQATTGMFSGNQSVYNTLSANEKAVYDNLMGKVIEVETKPSNNKKFPFLGCVFGVFIILSVIVIRYVLSTKLKTEDDLRSAFKLHIFGAIAKKNDDGLAVVCSSIMALSSTGKAKNILLCTSLAEGIATDYISRIKEFLMEKAVSTETAFNIVSDPTSIDKAAKSDGLIFFECIGESIYENIDKEVELASNLGINVLGAVVVK